MTKSKAIRLLNEALVGRTITGVGFEDVCDESHGELLVPYFEVDNVLKVMLGHALPRACGERKLLTAVMTGFVGYRIEHILGGERARLAIDEFDNPLPIGNVGLVGPEGRCQLSKVLQSSGLQVPYEVVSDGWGDDDDDIDQEEDDGGAEAWKLST